jgi:hypothetical protein
MHRNSLFIFFGLLLVAGAIFVHADNGRYAFAYSGIASSDRLTYAKLDTRTGEAWFCGGELDACVPMTNRAAFLAYADRVKTIGTIDQLRRAGISDDEIKQWMETQKRQP